MEEVGVFMIFVDLWIPCFEETLVGYFMTFVYFISWVYDAFMWVVHEIFHAMFEIKESRFYWQINVSTEVHGEILNIIASLDIYVHDATNPVIESFFMWFLNLSQLISNDMCIHEACLFNIYINWKGWLLEFYLIFCLCSPIFLNHIFMVWSVWSILITYLIWIILMLRRFNFDPPWKL